MAVDCRNADPALVQAEALGHAPTGPIPSAQEQILEQRVVELLTDWHAMIVLTFNGQGAVVPNALVPVSVLQPIARRMAELEADVAQIKVFLGLGLP